MNIPDDLEQLLTQAATQVGIAHTRDPQLVRAHIAQTGMCLTCSPASGIGRTLHGTVLAVPIHLVLAQTAGMGAVDRALRLAPDLCAALQVEGWAWDEAIPVGVEFYPGFTFDVEITVC
jgi:hypothetical protein